MDKQYKIMYDKKFDKDLHLIESRTISNYYNKLKDKINKEIEYLKFMPRMHRKVKYYNNPTGDYRRIVFDKYIIIYKIRDNQITILRIFSQKQNYLNSRNFILREKSSVYKIIK